MHKIGQILRNFAIFSKKSGFYGAKPSRSRLWWAALRRGRISSCSFFMALLLLSVQPGHALEPDSPRNSPVVRAVAKAMPGVVNIGTEKMVQVRYTDPFLSMRGDLLDRFFSDFFGPPPLPGYRIGHSLGSGVILDPRGYILTNYHVLERASRIAVILSDETRYDARIIAGDELTDLALIKIDPERPLTALDFAEDDDLLLGETVIVLGNPFGLTHTVSVGVLSAKNRSAQYQGKELYRDILQTDAAVNPGSSGGPLLNLDGNLIGVNVAVYQEAQNIGFAIPIKRVRALLGEWLSPQRLKNLWLGYELGDGLVISEVYEKTPAAAKGLIAGDVIVAVDGTPVRTKYDCNKAMLNKELGDIVRLTVMRGERRMDADLAFEDRPKPSGRDLAARRLGITFGDPGTQQSPYPMGLPVAQVEEGCPAAQSGLRAGDWISRINSTEIRTLDDAGAALQNVKTGDPVGLVAVKLEEQGAFMVSQRTTLSMPAR